jgi:hypothetical protein
MEGLIHTPAGILSFGKNILGEQVYAIIKKNAGYPVFIRKAFPSEVKEFVKV